MVLRNKSSTLIVISLGFILASSAISCSLETENAQTSQSQLVSDNTTDSISQSDEQNAAYLADFIKKNPQASNLGRLFRSKPNPRTQPYVAVINNDTYRISPIGSDNYAPVITMGQHTKFATLVSSLKAIRDPETQLSIYSSLYSKVSLLDSGNTDQHTVFPAPESLQGRPLSEVLSYNKSIADRWQQIYAGLAPIGVPSHDPVTCATEIGAGNVADTAALFGDQRTPFASECNADPDGIMGKFNFPGKADLTCVKNQGPNRGVCHSFAVASATEQLIAAKYGRHVNLSEQDLVSHYRSLWAPADYIDSGDPGEIIRKIQSSQYTFAYENQWEYNPSFKRSFEQARYLNSCIDYPNVYACSETTHQAQLECVPFQGGQRCSYGFQRITTRSPYTITKAVELWDPANPELATEYVLMSLMFGNPVIATMEITENFSRVSSQGNVVYDAEDLKKSAGQHAVHVVGFITNEDVRRVFGTGGNASGGGYFIIKNSWSTCRGDGGYVYVPFDYLKSQTISAISVSGVN